MAALHSALQTLSPTSFSSVPCSEQQANEYLQDSFSKAQLIIDSVPPPSIEDSINAARSRSASVVSGSSEMSASSARSDPLNPSHLPFQKEWGKPIKLAAKDNPLGIAVYKLAGKDGRGAWFARRSVHEGMGFKKWKLGLQKEFPESMQVQGGPGEGNIRGIGGERRIERMEFKGVGTIEVYHLSAQFPGPTAPRDFVTLLLTSSSALGNFSSSHPASGQHDENSRSSQFGLGARHFMVISRPCTHPDCPPRDGFIRGQYESIEFIREIPLKPKKSSSTTELLKTRRGRASSSSMDRKARLREAYKDQIPEEKALDDIQVNDKSPRNSLDVGSSARGRRRGRTISFAESRGISAKGEAMDVYCGESEDLEETNPVEWIMVTRSDPGGSVPRFLVERGTPSGIVADAVKFVDWAFKKEHPEDMEEVKEAIGETNGIQPGSELDLESYQTNGHLAGLDSITQNPEPQIWAEESDNDSNSKAPKQSRQGGLFASAANVAYSGIESYAPQIVINHLAGNHQTPAIAPSTIAESEGGTSNIPNDIRATRDNEDTHSISSASSLASFASAEDHFEDASSLHSSTSLLGSSQTKDTSISISPQEKELAKLDERKRNLDEKLAKVREKEAKDKEELTIQEERRIRRAEEKHAHEVRKQEQKYKREVAKLETKRAREVAKEEERRKRNLDKDDKARLTRERDQYRQRLEVVCKERDILKGQVGALQKENTALVVKIGKMGEGPDLLRDIRAELSGGLRDRSGSLRKPKAAANSGSSAAGESEATVLAEPAEKKE